MAHSLAPHHQQSMLDTCQPASSIALYLAAGQCNWYLAVCKVDIHARLALLSLLLLLLLLLLIPAARCGTGMVKQTKTSSASRGASSTSLITRCHWSVPNTHGMHFKPI